jgi:hypothetical protein
LTEGLDLQVQMTLREISSAVFTDESASVFEQNNTTLPDPFTGLVVDNLSVTGGGRTQSDGTFLNFANLSWDDVANAFVSYYEVEWKPSADSTYASTTTTDNTVELSPIIDNVLYALRVRAVNALGVKGPYSSVTFTAGGDTTAPTEPTSVSATGNYGFISLQWTNPPDADFSNVQIWENTSNNSSTATQIASSFGSTFVRGNLSTNVTRYYWLKSVDRSGNVSGFSSVASATTDFIDNTAFENGVINLFLDQGLGPIPSGSTFPPTPSNGDQFFLTTDGQLYQYVAANTRWELQVEPGSIVASDKIVANTITGGLLATSGIITNSAQINNAVIQSANIQNLAVERIKIANGAITNKGSIANSWSFSQPVNTGVYGSTSFPPVGSFPTSSFILIGQQTYTVPTDAPSSISFEVGLTITLLYSLLSTAPAANHENGWWHHLRIEDSSGNLIQGSTYALVQQFQSNGYVVFTPNHRTFGVQVPTLFRTTNYVAGQVLTFKNYFYRYRSSTAYGLGLNSTGGLIQYEEFYK